MPTTGSPRASMRADSCARSSTTRFSSPLSSSSARRSSSMAASRAADSARSFWVTSLRRSSTLDQMLTERLDALVDAGLRLPGRPGHRQNARCSTSGAPTPVSVTSWSLRRNGRKRAISPRACRTRCPADRSNRAVPPGEATILPIMAITTPTQRLTSVSRLMIVSARDGGFRRGGEPAAGCGCRGARGWCGW